MTMVMICLDKIKQGEYLMKLTHSKKTKTLLIVYEVHSKQKTIKSLLLMIK